MRNHDRLIAAANSLSRELREKVVFVGGCTVHLYLDEQQGRVDIRPTEDVDVIVEVYKLIDWYQIEEEIRALGFAQSMSDDDPVCRYRKGDVIIDFMPTDENVLGFSNRWYKQAISSFSIMPLAENLSIKYVSIGYFVLTKFEAYRGRGGGDILASHDIEDVLTVFAGRSSIERELMDLPDDEKTAIRSHLETLIVHPDFNYAVTGCFPSDRATGQLVQARIKNTLKFLSL